MFLPLEPRASVARRFLFLPRRAGVQALVPPVDL
jgi:hypothetical protein